MASRIVAEFKRLTALLMEHPEIGSLRAEGQQHFSMKVFPYTVVYRASTDEIRILVI